MVMLVCVAFATAAQQQRSEVRGQRSAKIAKAATPAIAPARAVRPDAEAAPTLPAEELLKIRNIQIGQLQRSVQMVQLENTYAKLQQQQKADAEEYSRFLAEAEKKAGIDVTKWEFDPVTLKFTAKKITEPAPATDAAPPKGRTPNSKPETP
jgi:hypothetical protein